MDNILLYNNFKYTTLNFVRILVPTRGINGRNWNYFGLLSAYLLFFMLLLIEKNLFILLWRQKYNCSTVGKDYFIPNSISNET